MAIVTRQMFADLCGDDVKYLNVYISRRKVVLYDAEGKNIDTENPFNKEYLKKRKLANQTKKEETETIKLIQANPAHPPRKKNTSVSSNDDDEDDIPEPLSDEMIRAVVGGSISEPGSVKQWMEMKLKGDAELVTLRVEKEKILLAKAAGELLPVDVAMNAHRIYMRTIVTSFETAIMNIANKFCHIMAGGDMDMFTKITEECRKELARCVSDAGGETNRDLEQMIKEFSSARRPGEKKTA